MGFEHDEFSLDWREIIKDKEEIKAKVQAKPNWLSFPPHPQLNSYLETTISQSYPLYRILPYVLDLDFHLTPTFPSRILHSDSQERNSSHLLGAQAERGRFC